MSDDNQTRYEDILKRIAQRKPFGKSQVEAKPRSAYDLILDSVNAYDTLNAIRQKPHKRVIVHGPKSRQRSTWSGVMIWYRDKGYHGYKSLKLFGVWAHQINADIFLTIGIRQLTYSASIYNAEGYFATIRKDFKLFYDDNGHPPTDADTILFQTLYNAKERLTYRQTLSKIMNQWYADVNSS